MKNGRDFSLARLAVFLVIFLAGCGGGTTPLSIVTTSLADDTIGSPYSATVQAAGGAPPFAWSISAGTLPDTLRCLGQSQRR